MLTKRIVACLDMDHGRVVKGIQFRQLQDAGDPLQLAREYDWQGADEIVFLDVGASCQSRDIMIEVVEKVSSEIFIPLTVGGGLRTTEDMRRALHAGADKVALCTSALREPDLIGRGAAAFGSQCIVISIDARRVGDSWQAYSHGGRVSSGRDALEWAAEAEERGAGEILLNSIDCDGTGGGYDIELLRLVSGHAAIPVIASGGGGTLPQMALALAEGKADAILVASVLHFGRLGIPEIKRYLKKEGVPIR